MKKGLRLPLALFVVLLIMAGIAYWDEKKTDTEKVAKEHESMLYNFKAEDIVSITATHPQVHAAAYTLKKEDKTWVVTEPFHYAADSDGIDRFVKLLLDAKYERQFDRSERELKEFGLETPQFSYTLTDKSGKSWTFAMGGKSPTGYASYVRTSDDKHLFLVNQYLFTATNKTLSDFRNRSLFLPLAADVQAIKLDVPNQPSLSVVRKDKDWELTTPIQSKADTAEVNKYFGAWDQLRVVDFIDSPEPALRKALTEVGKGTKEYLQIAFIAKSGTKDISILENNDKLYTRIDDKTFAELDKKQVDALKKTAHDLEDRSLFTFVSTDVTELTVDAKHYHQKDKRWVEGAEDKRADFVQGILANLEFTKAERKLTAAEGEALAKGAPQNTVSLKAGDKTVAELSLWKRTDNPQRLLLKANDKYFEVASDFMEIFSPKMGKPRETIGGEVPGDHNHPH